MYLCFYHARRSGNPEYIEEALKRLVWARKFLKDLNINK